MTSRTRYGGAVLLLLAAGVGLASLPQAAAQAVPAGENPDPPMEEAAALDANDVDIRDLQLDWSQLNVDASTLTIRPGSKARSPQAGPGTEMSWSSKDKPNGSAALSVKQPPSPFWDARVGAHITVARQPAPPRAAGAADEVRTFIGKTGERRQPAAILRIGMGGDHGPRRRLDLGQDRDRSPDRSLAGKEQARHLLEQVAAAERAVFAHPAERLQHHPAGQ